MPTRAALALLACLGGAEAAQAQASLAQADQLYQTAVQNRWEGRNAAAIEGLRRVLQTRPEDLDARLHLALALMALDRLDEAEHHLDIVVARAPDYADAKEALTRIERLRAQHTNWRLDVSGAYGELSAGLGTWRDTSVNLGRRIGNGTVSASVEHSERFGQTNTYFEGRLDQKTETGSVYAAVGGASDASFRPESALRFGGQALVGDGGVSMTMDAVIARYRVGTVSSLQPGLEYSSGSGAVTVGVRWINVWDEQATYQSGYSLRALLAVSPSVRLRAGLADAPESTDGTTVAVRAVGLGAEIDVRDGLTLRLNRLHEARRAYDREEVTVGFGLRF